MYTVNVCKHSYLSNKYNALHLNVFICLKSSMPFHTTSL